MADVRPPETVFDLSGSNPWQLLERSVAFADDRLTVRKDRVLQPDGQEGTYTFVELDGPVVAMVPLDAEDHVYLVRQWRYPWQRNSWEIPAGHCEGGEEPEVAARRELAEEVALAASDWQALGYIHNSALLPNRTYLYLARGLTPVSGSTRDGAEEDMLVQRVPLAAAVDAVMSGQIVHALSVAALLKTARLLSR